MHFFFIFYNQSYDCQGMGSKTGGSPSHGTDDDDIYGNGDDYGYGEGDDDVYGDGYGDDNYDED
jgi:hypothetical protein